MKKLFLKLSMLLFLLCMSINIAWAQDYSQAKIYVASLKAQTSPASVGSGDVKLTWVDIKGDEMDVDLAHQLNKMALGNESHISGPDETAQLLGGTLFAMDGIETSMGSDHMYMTSYVYFWAEAVPANGSYFSHWTFTDPAISRIDTAMGYIVYQQKQNEETGEWEDDLENIDEDKTVPLKYPCFKVLPDTVNNGKFGDTKFNTSVAKVVAQPNNLYAVFNKYLLSNPVATSGQLDAVKDNTAKLDVSVDVEGDISQFKDNYADFEFPTDPTSLCQAYGRTEEPFAEDESGYWTWDLAKNPVEFPSATKARAHVVVTYTAKEGITVGTHKATITIKMAGGEDASVLNIPLAVTALAPIRPQASLLNGKEKVEEGNFDDLLAHVGNYAKPVLVLNKDIDKNITFSNKTFTLDLNGNTVNGTITVSSGEVTFAYNMNVGEADALRVTGGKVILNGGVFGTLTNEANGTVEQNGATITGEATNKGTWTTNGGKFNGGLTSSKTLTINNGTFNGETAVTVSGGTALINRGTIEGTACGLEVTGGKATVKKLAAIKGGTNSVSQNGGTVEILSGKFDGALSAVATFTAGYFKNKADADNVKDGKEWMQLTNGVEFNEGYRFFLGDAEIAKTNGVGVCRIGDVAYATLEDAIEYANNNPTEENIVIFMTNNYTLPAGNYTLPANATIVVPMSDEQAKEVNTVAPRVSFHDMDRSHPYMMPHEFRRLTFARGVNMDVYGKMEMTCTQFASNEAYTGQPYGPYGHLVMEEGSHMTLMAGAEIRAWGFVTGKGEMDARRDATVREMFQMGDWKGAMTSVKITGMMPKESPVQIGDESAKNIFPVSQYFIQNIESPVKYHPGAVLSTSATVAEGLMNFLAVSMAAQDIKIVGVNERDSAIFVMDNGADAENTWVRKWYDAENDIQVYDVNNSAHIGQMVLDMGELDASFMFPGLVIPVRLNSGKFDLPITTNMKIHLLSGTMDFLQNTSLLPGSEVEVDKKSMVTVTLNEQDPSHTGALYVYDKQDWGQYAYGNAYNPESGSNETYEAYTKVVRYAPSWNGQPEKRNEQICPPSAAINVHGTFQTNTGYVYTSQHGANIFSTNKDAGTFVFNDNAEDAGERTVWNVEGSSAYRDQVFYPAKLKQGDDSYARSDTARVGDAYCYIDDKWQTMYPDENNPCFMVKHNAGGDIFYAKPQSYVAVVASKVYDDENNFVAIKGNEDHTYSDKAGTGRLFILMEDDCQWWEVEKKGNLYHCLHLNNDVYYYWGYDKLDEKEKWMVKYCTITWKNYDNEPLVTTNAIGIPSASYTVPYGSMAEYVGANPTRPMTIDSTYNFVGWKPALDTVKQDVTYKAVFEPKPRMYTVIFREDGGAEIERKFVEAQKTPICENVPTREGYYLQWMPALGPTTQDTVYVAQWFEELPDTYKVSFRNNDGSLLKKADGIEDAVYEVSKEGEDFPVYDGTKPSKVFSSQAEKEMLEKENVYEFKSWLGFVNGEDREFGFGDNLPRPTNADITYVAQYTSTPRPYTIRFFQENGTTQIGDDQFVTYDNSPVIPAYSKEPTKQYTFDVLWRNKDDKTQAVQPVVANTDYIAVIDTTVNKYTVTLKSNLTGVCTFTGAGTFDYGKNVNNVEVTYDSEKYRFDGWDDGQKTPAHAAFTLTEDITLTANFTAVALEDYELGGNAKDTLTEPKEVKDFILTSNGIDASGQIFGANYLDIKGDAIFKLAPAAGIPARTWYAVAAPWQVDIRTGVYANGKRLAVGAGFDMIAFDATAYARDDNGEGNRNIWKYVDEDGGIMQPGKLYMVYLASSQPSLEFHMKRGTSIITVKTSVDVTGGTDAKANWNAIANPALFRADLGLAGSSDVLKYDPASGGYTTTDVNNMIVAEPVFAQVAAKQPTVTAFVATTGGGAGMPAYRRAPKTTSEADSRFVIEIARNGQMNDRLIVQTAEDKDNTYVIGQDLAKMGIGSKAAQMWMERYNTNLCKNTAQIENGRAEFPLSIFAPAAGEYTISALAQRGDLTLYLTRDGEAIANLSDGDYTLMLERGTAYQYGLRVSARSPQVATGCDEIVAEGAGNAQKVLVNGQIFIIRGEKAYTVDGQLVK